MGADGTTEQRKVIYIAGPMSGLPDWNFPAFHEAEEAWREAGWEVNNPARAFGGRTDLPYPQYLRHGIGKVLESDALAVLDGWEASRGCRAEMFVADLVGIPIYVNAPFSPEQPHKGIPLLTDIKLVCAATDPFRQVLEEIDDLHTRKRADYTGNGSALANYNFASRMVGLTTLQGMFQRLCEKVFRARNIIFIKNGKPSVEDETLSDTFKDMAIIAILSVLYLRGAEGYVDPVQRLEDILFELAEQARTT